ncbi:MAG: peptidoglycan-binding protein [Candidatus Paceibacterota bacterium]
MKKYILPVLLLALSFTNVQAQAVPTTSSSCTDLSYNLGYGSNDGRTNGEVTKLQTFLSSLGYLKDKPNGYFGRSTFGALKSFQLSKGLTNSGYAGQQTRGVIKKMTCGSIPTSSMNSSDFKFPDQTSVLTKSSVLPKLVVSGTQSKPGLVLCGDGVVDKPSIDAGPILTSCFLANKNAGIIELLPGKYYIKSTIDIGNLSNITIKTKGVSSGSACLQVGSAPCAVLFATADNKGPVILKSEGASKLNLFYIAIDGNRLARWSPGTTPNWIKNNETDKYGTAYNAAIRYCDKCHFTGFASVRAPKGTGLEFIGADAVFDTTLFSDNGWQLSDWFSSNPEAGAFADGLTALISERIVIRNSEFSNNSDINLILGDAPGAVIENNIIKSDNKFVFAGLMVDNFMRINNVIKGRFDGTVIRNNTISCGNGLCGIGIDVGPYLWYAKKGETNVDVERVTGGIIANNTVFGARQGILVSGASGTTINNNTVNVAGTFKTPVGHYKKLNDYQTRECVTNSISASQGDTVTISDNKNSQGQTVVTTSNELRECHPYDLSDAVLDLSVPTIPPTPTAVITPTVTASWSPSIITSGQAATLTWSSTNATYCNVSHPNNTNTWNNAPTSRTTPYSSVITSDTTTVTCYNSTGQSDSKTVTLTVNPVILPTPTAVITPTVTASWSPSTITSGQAATLTWSSTNATYCNVSHPNNINPWNNAPTSRTTPYSSVITSDTTTITCYNQAGQSDSETVTLTVNQPSFCTDFTYSDYSLCQSGGIKTRSVVSSSPQGCTGGVPLTSISCSYVVKTTKVNTLYNIFLRRNSDPSGELSFQNQLSKGATLADVAWVLLTSPEGIATNGVNVQTMSVDSYVEFLYTAVLKRPSDVEGKRYWVATVNAGVTRKSALSSFLDSPESKITNSNLFLSYNLQNSSSISVDDKSIPTVLGDYISVPSCINLPQNLHRGAESSLVRLLQSFLIAKGLLAGNATGFYGDKTVEAVKAYQSSVNLPATGMVYDFTRNAIKVESCQ